MLMRHQSTHKKNLQSGPNYQQQHFSSAGCMKAKMDRIDGAPPTEDRDLEPPERIGLESQLNTHGSESRTR